MHRVPRRSTIRPALKPRAIGPWSNLNREASFEVPNFVCAFSRGRSKHSRSALTVPSGHFRLHFITLSSGGGQTFFYKKCEHLKILLMLCLIMAFLLLLPAWYLRQRTLGYRKAGCKAEAGLPESLAGHRKQWKRRPTGMRIWSRVETWRNFIRGRGNVVITSGAG